MSAPDKNLLSLTGEIGRGNLGHLVPPDGTFADTLKFSAAHDGCIDAGDVVGGTEDCLDVNNRCARLWIAAHQWLPTGRYLCSIKGGSRTITVSGGVCGHGREVDVDLGNWSDQSSEATRGVRLMLSTADGSPITVRVLNAEWPRLLNADEQEYRFAAISYVPLWAKRIGFAIWAIAKRQKAEGKRQNPNAETREAIV